ncbi:protein kinase [Cystoisospora suis]|uniref:Protein kinase n=1 Tax=Cystoisospora suis TaxID=483139 RepID=A0A2C6KMA6_9APIC|nr:protein kinase [Cystoisospora suis]
MAVYCPSCFTSASSAPPHNSSSPYLLSPCCCGSCYPSGAVSHVAFPLTPSLASTRCCSDAENSLESAALAAGCAHLRTIQPLPPSGSIETFYKLGRILSVCQQQQVKDQRAAAAAAAAAGGAGGGAQQAPGKNAGHLGGQRGKAESGSQRGWRPGEESKERVRDGGGEPAKDDGADNKEKRADGLHTGGDGGGEADEGGGGDGGPAAAMCNSTRPVLRYATTRTTHQPKIIKSIDKQRIPASAGGDRLWRRLCTRLLNLPPHRHVLSLDAVYEGKQKFYFVSEKLEGGELFDFLLTEKTVEEHICQYIIFQILHALHHLHSNNLLHRDIKPENLMFRRRRRSGAERPASSDENCTAGERSAVGSAVSGTAVCPSGGTTADSSAGEASPRWSYPAPLPGAAPLTALELEHELVLIDFDTCRMMEVSPHEYGEVTGGQRRLVGTYGYLAPEVLRGGDYSVQSDLWSVGVILYILMTGIPPLPMELLTSARASLLVFAQVQEKQGGIDYDVFPLPDFPLARNLCQKLLQINPRQRLSSAREALRHPWLRDFTLRFGDGSPACAGAPVPGSLCCYTCPQGMQGEICSAPPSCAFSLCRCFHRPHTQSNSSPSPRSGYLHTAPYSHHGSSGHTCGRGSHFSVNSSAPQSQDIAALLSAVSVGPATNGPSSGQSAHKNRQCGFAASLPSLSSPSRLPACWPPSESGSKGVRNSEDGISPFSPSATAGVGQSPPMLPPLRAQGDTPLNGGPAEEIIDAGVESRSSAVGMTPVGNRVDARFSINEERNEFQVAEGSSGTSKETEQNSSCLVWLGSPPAPRSKGDLSVDGRGDIQLSGGGEGRGGSTSRGPALHGSGERDVGLYGLSSSFKTGVDAAPFTFESVAGVDAAESSTAASSSQPARSLFSSRVSGGSGCSLSPSVLSPLNQCGSSQQAHPVSTSVSLCSRSHVENQRENKHGQGADLSTDSEKESTDLSGGLMGSADAAVSANSVVRFGFSAAAAAAAAALGFGSRSEEQQADIDCSSSRLTSRSSSGSEFVAEEMEDETPSNGGKETLTAAVFPVASTASSLQDGDTPQLRPVPGEPRATPNTNAETECAETPRSPRGLVSGDLRLTATGQEHIGLASGFSKSFCSCGSCASTGLNETCTPQRKQFGRRGSYEVSSTSSTACTPSKRCLNLDQGDGESPYRSSCRAAHSLWVALPDSQQTALVSSPCEQATTFSQKHGCCDLPPLWGGANFSRACLTSAPHYCSEGDSPCCRRKRLASPGCFGASPSPAPPPLRSFPCGAEYTTEKAPHGERQIGHPPAEFPDFFRDTSSPEVAEELTQPVPSVSSSPSYTVPGVGFQNAGASEENAATRTFATALPTEESSSSFTQCGDISTSENRNNVSVASGQHQTRAHSANYLILPQPDFSASCQQDGTEPCIITGGDTSNPPKHHRHSVFPSCGGELSTSGFSLGPSSVRPSCIRAGKRRSLMSVSTEGLENSLRGCPGAFRSRPRSASSSSPFSPSSGSIPAPRSRHSFCLPGVSACSPSSKFPGSSCLYLTPTSASFSSSLTGGGFSDGGRFSLSTNGSSGSFQHSVVSYGSQASVEEYRGNSDLVAGAPQRLLCSQSHRGAARYTLSSMHVGSAGALGMGGHSTAQLGTGSFQQPGHSYGREDDGSLLGLTPSSRDNASCVTGAHVLPSCGEEEEEENLDVDTDSNMTSDDDMTGFDEELGEMATSGGPASVVVDTLQALLKAAEDVFSMGTGESSPL